jgi:hypothetical protein
MSVTTRHLCGASRQAPSWVCVLQYGRNMMLADVPAEEFQAIADLGIEVVWLMGVWSLGECVHGTGTHVLLSHICM